MSTRESLQCIKLIVGFVTFIVVMMTLAEAASNGEFLQTVGMMILVGTVGSCTIYWCCHANPPASAEEASSRSLQASYVMLGIVFLFALIGSASGHGTAGFVWVVWILMVCIVVYAYNLHQNGDYAAAWEASNSAVQLGTVMGVHASVGITERAVAIQPPLPALGPAEPDLTFMQVAYNVPTSVAPPPYAQAIQYQYPPGHYTPYYTNAHYPQPSNHYPQYC